jgi:hypothetical protein
MQQRKKEKLVRQRIFPEGFLNRGDKGSLLPDVFERSPFEHASAQKRSRKTNGLKAIAYFSPAF